MSLAFDTSKHKAATSEIGSKFRNLFHIRENAKIINEGDEDAVIVKEIVLDGKEDIQEKINSNYENSLLKNILARYQITGDTNLLNVFQPLDPEIHAAMNNIPMDSADAAQYMNDNHDKIVKSTGLPENFTNEDLQNYIKAEVSRQTAEKGQEKSTVETKSEPQKKETIKETKTVTETKGVEENGNKQ